jgi:hypothetical protein
MFGFYLIFQTLLPYFFHNNLNLNIIRIYNMSGGEEQTEREREREREWVN